MKGAINLSSLLMIARNVQFLDFKSYLDIFLGCQFILLRAVLNVTVAELQIRAEVHLHFAVGLLHMFGRRQVRADTLSAGQNLQI